MTELDPMQYPFSLPSPEYLWHGGRIEPIENWDGDTTGRCPVLAFGSNAAPVQLDRKFADSRWRQTGADDSDIPVVMVSAQHIDVVYSAYVSSYGAIPVTLVECPGAIIATHLIWLTKHQFARMDETEGLRSTYTKRAVAHVERGGHQIPGVWAYLSQHGAALFAGELLGLGSTEASRTSVTSRGDQHRAWDLLAHDMGYPTPNDPKGSKLHEYVLSGPDARQVVQSHLDTHRLPLA